MKLKRLDHVGVIVANLDAASEFANSALGLSASRGVKLPELIATFFGAGNADLELIEVTDPEMRRVRLGDQVARVEHIAFEVENLAETLNVLEKLGIKITAPPRVSGPTTSVWTVAETSGGIMFQFLERSPPQA